MIEINSTLVMWFLRVSNIHKVFAFIYLIAPIVAITVMLAKGSHVDIGTILFMSIFLIPAVIHYLAILGLKKKKTWGRFLSMFLGIVLLFLFPIGTIAGLFILFQMFSKNWKQKI